MTLIDAPLNKNLIVIKMDKTDSYLRLKSMGLFEGTKLVKLRQFYSFGPIEILLDGFRLVIRKKMAKKIYVEVLDEKQ